MNRSVVHQEELAQLYKSHTGILCSYVKKKKHLV